MKKRLIYFLATLLCCGTLLADGPPPHAKREPQPDPVGMKEPDQREHILRMAKQYGVAPELIEKARIAGIGVGEIDVVIDMAKAAKKDPEEVIGLRKKGATWVKIAEGYGVKLEDVVKDEDARTSLVQGEQNLAKNLGDQHGLTEEQVVAYRAQLSDWGETRLALTLAKMSGQPVDALIARFLKGEGWGTIGKDFDINIGRLMRDPKSNENFGGQPTPHEPKAKKAEPAETPAEPGTPPKKDD